MTTYEHLRSSRAPVRPALLRREPSVIGGVCQGLSVHLGGSVLAWRMAFVALGFVGGLGVMLYLILAMTTPREGKEPAITAPLAPPLDVQSAEVKVRKERERRPLLVIALILGLTGVTLLLGISGATGEPGILFPLLIALAGAGIAWSHPVGGEGSPMWLTITGGMVAAAGALGIAATLWGADIVTTGISVTLLVSSTLAAVLLPVLWQNRARFEEEREARIRESERADIAAHLHDSVLQTLALIRSRATDPDEVTTLARSQERDLRWYLYNSRPEKGSSFASELREAADKIEERFRAEIESVITGDVVPDSRTAALLGATREALTNACKHGGGRVSLFAQLSPEGSEVFIRDRGPGFDPENIDSNRAGIRDSIRGRLSQVHGNVEIRSPLTSGGTEVRMSI